MMVEGITSRVADENYVLLVEIMKIMIILVEGITSRVADGNYVTTG